MHHQVGSSQEHSDAVERVLRQAEMSRLTRNLKSKLALASRQAQQSPAASQTPPPAGPAARKRAKTLEGASSAPRFTAASEPARRPSQQKRYSLPSASPRGGSAPYRTTPSRSSSRPLSRTASATAIPPMPTLPAFFVDHAPAYAPQMPRAPALSQADAASAASEASRAAQAAAAAAPSPPPARDLRQARPERAERAEPPARSDAQPQPRGGDADEPLPAVPQTPPQRRRAARSPRENPQTPERRRDPEDGASLLLHFAHSPGHAVATPRTPDFNMSDYLHFQTPSPARPARMGTPRRLNHWGSLSSLSSLSSSNIFVPSQAGGADSTAPTPMKASTLLSPTQHPPMPSFPAGAHIGLEKSPSDL